MAIWNEIKRSINSNLSKPLNELIGESIDNTTVMDKLDTLINNGGNSNSGGVQYMNAPENIINIECGKLPYNFRYGSTVVYNNEIHILGGYGYSTYHYKWNGSSWSSVSTLPYGLSQGSAVVYNDELHIMRGTYHYKWDGSSWSSVSTLPYNFSESSAVVYNNQIHILGGYNGINNYRTYHYRWSGSSWSSASTLPYGLCQGSVVVYNNEIHILGGYNYSKYHYKWNGSSWSSVSTSIYGFIGGSTVVYNNEIHAFQYEYHYKWDGSSWSDVGVVPYRFTDGSTVVYNNEIHILGGALTNIQKNHYRISKSIHLLIHQPSIISTLGECDLLCIRHSDDVVLIGEVENGYTALNITTPGLYNILSEKPFAIIQQ